MSMLSQITQLLQIYRILFLFLLTPIIIYPITPFFSSYIFKPLLYLPKKFFKNYAYFFVYDFITKKPICCTLIYILTQDNKKYLTITNKQGIAYFLPNNKHKDFVKIYHPIYKAPDFNTMQIKDNVFIKKMPNSYIYLSKNQGIAFPLIKKRDIFSKLLDNSLQIISYLYFTLFSIFYFWTFLIFINQQSFPNLIILILTSLLYTLYIQSILGKEANIYPNSKIAKVPFTIQNILNNQEVAIIHKNNIPILLEKGHYQAQINDISIPLKLEKIGALYFVKDKA